MTRPSTVEQAHAAHAAIKALGASEAAAKAAADAVTAALRKEKQQTETSEALKEAKAMAEAKSVSDIDDLTAGLAPVGPALLSMVETGILSTKLTKRGKCDEVFGKNTENAEEEAAASWSILWEESLAVMLLNHDVVADSKDPTSMHDSSCVQHLRDTNDISAIVNGPNSKRLQSDATILDNINCQKYSNQFISLAGPKGNYIIDLRKQRLERGLECEENAQRNKYWPVCMHGNDSRISRRDPGMPSRRKIKSPRKHYQLRTRPKGEYIKTGRNFVERVSSQCVGGADDFALMRGIHPAEQYEDLRNRIARDTAEIENERVDAGGVHYDSSPSKLSDDYRNTQERSNNIALDPTRQLHLPTNGGIGEKDRATSQYSIGKCEERFLSQKDAAPPRYEGQIPHQDPCKVAKHEARSVAAMPATAIDVYTGDFKKRCNNGEEQLAIVRQPLEKRSSCWRGARKHRRLKARHNIASARVKSIYSSKAKKRGKEVDKKELKYHGHMQLSEQDLSSPNLSISEKRPLENILPIQAQPMDNTTASQHPAEGGYNSNDKNNFPTNEAKQPPTSKVKGDSSEEKLLAALQKVPRNRRENLLRMLEGMERTLLGDSIELPPTTVAMKSCPENINSGTSKQHEENEPDIKVNEHMSTLRADSRMRSCDASDEVAQEKKQTIVGQITHTNGGKKVKKGTGQARLKHLKQNVARPVATRRLLEKLGTALVGMRPRSERCRLLDQIAAAQKQRRTLSLSARRIKERLCRDLHIRADKQDGQLSRKPNDSDIALSLIELRLLTDLLETGGHAYRGYGGAEMTYNYWALLSEHVVPAFLELKGSLSRQLPEVPVIVSNETISSTSGCKNIHKPEVLMETDRCVVPTTSNPISTKKTEGNKDILLAPVPLVPLSHMREGNEAKIGATSKSQATKGNDSQCSNILIQRIAKVASHMDPCRAPIRLQHHPNHGSSQHGLKLEPPMGLYEFQATIDSELAITMSLEEIQVLACRFSSRTDRLIYWPDFVEWFWSVGKEHSISERKKEAQESFKRAYSHEAPSWSCASKPPKEDQNTEINCENDFTISSFLGIADEAKISEDESPNSEQMNKDFIQEKNDDSRARLLLNIGDPSATLSEVARTNEEDATESGPSEIKDMERFIGDRFQASMPLPSKVIDAKEGKLLESCVPRNNQRIAPVEERLEECETFKQHDTPDATLENYISSSGFIDDHTCSAEGKHHNSHNQTYENEDKIDTLYQIGTNPKKRNQLIVVKKSDDINCEGEIRSDDTIGSLTASPNFARITGDTKKDAVELGYKKNYCPKDNVSVISSTQEINCKFSTSFEHHTPLSQTSREEARYPPPSPPEISTGYIIHTDTLSPASPRESPPNSDSADDYSENNFDEEETTRF